MRRQTCLTVMLLVSLVASSSGQVYGRKQQTVDNAVLTAMVSIPQVNADGDKISGTYIPISATASAQDIGGPVADKVTAVRLKQAVLTVGGETLYTDNFNVSWSEPSPVTQKRSARSQSVMLSSNESGDFVLEGGQGSPPVPFADIKDPRDPIFSSTHFVHEVQVVVSLTLTFSLKRASGATFDVTLESAVIKPKAWNRVTMWRTQVNEFGFPLVPQYEAWIAAATNVAISKYIAANYSVGIVDPGSKASILADMATSTSVFALTHGSPSSVSDSLSVNAAGSIEWSEFETALGDRYSSSATMRPLSHVFVYACITVPGQDPDRFWLWKDQQGLFRNSASYGFKQKYNFCPEEQEHINELFTQFNTGTIAYTALLNANINKPIPASTGARGTKAPLFFAAGDTYQTFNHVFLPRDVRDALPAPQLYASWWWAPPHTP